MSRIDRIKYGDTTYDITPIGETVLYNDDTGTKDTVVLSETAAHFDYIEIFYGKGNATYFSSVKVFKPNQKSVNLVIIWRFQAGGIQFQTQGVVIQDTNILREAEAYSNIMAGDTSIGVGDQKDISIFRVVGYKFETEDV